MKTFVYPTTLESKDLFLYTIDDCLNCITFVQIYIDYFYLNIFNSINLFF